MRCIVRCINTSDFLSLFPLERIVEDNSYIYSNVFRKQILNTFLPTYVLFILCKIVFSGKFVDNLVNHKYVFTMYIKFYIIP